MSVAMVGREAELGRAVHPRGQLAGMHRVALVTGEAGIGKTHLAGAVEDHAGVTGCRTLYAVGVHRLAVTSPTHR